MKQARAHSAKVQVQTHVLLVLSPFTEKVQSIGLEY